MVRAARALLSSVTRLLILADMADVLFLLKKLRIAQQSMQKVKDSRTQEELLKNFKVDLKTYLQQLQKAYTKII